MWHITKHAIETYMRVTGVTDFEAARQALTAQAAEAHYVKPAKRPDTEIWRGPAPLRLRLFVHTQPTSDIDEPQLLWVEAAGLGASQGRPAKRVRIWDGNDYRNLDVVQIVLESGGERRVAYKLTDGTWIEGYRSRQRPDHVERIRVLTKGNPPTWTKR